MKEMEHNKWKDILCQWIGKINNVKKSKLRKAIYRFKAVPIKILMEFLPEREQIILKPKGNNRS